MYYQLKKDWIPYSLPKLVSLCRYWNNIFLNETVPKEFHWDAGLCKGAADKIRAFTDACDACIELDTSYHLNLRRETRVAAIAGMRAFAASSVRNNPYMTDSDREKMGLRKPDTTPTQHKRPESRPTTVVERTVNFFEHRVKAIDTETGRNVKPADAYGVRFVWQAGGERPANGAAILKGKFCRKPETTVAYDETDRGKTAWYACCYENAKGEAGPWSPVVEAYIA